MWKFHQMNLRSTHRKRSLWDLNSDCLNHICSFLEPKDQLILILVNNHVSIKFLNELVENFTKTEIKKILSQTGDRIQQIQYKIRDRDEFRKHFSQYNSLVERFCPKATLALDSVKCNLSDKDSKLISTLLRLEYLKLTSLGRITGRYLENIINLSHLHISNCRLLSSAYFMQILLGDKLKSATIKYCRGIENAAIQALFELPDLENIGIREMNGPDWKWNLRINPVQLKNLKNLTIGGSLCRNVLSELSRQPIESLNSLHLSPRETKKFPEIREKIVRFRSLKTLGIYSDWEIIDDQFLHQIGLNCRYLEKLLIPNTYQITYHGILALIKNCTYLKYLDISGCKAFNEEVFYKIVDLCMEMKSSYPLKIVVFFTSIEKDFLKTQGYQKSKDFVILLCDMKYNYFKRLEEG